ncbi:CPBP family intramembrane glutamic endopeptidase [Brevibacillus choshinensis]|uniref:CPBP family intramembrane metalloprotease n=1 Tax=Brevibacillus choshinensis TaxID=54911 RepID=A0ABX7FWH6_BRECH|nr:CPBP family intramembrane glutamic endopeptidase [Brevibacillus choshinensis]QRG69876.1 CPBP family intramembrane metalloprotease [Brevibacillus choshinensis]
MKDSGQEMDEANLRLNLWLTQGLVLAIAAGSSFFFHGVNGTRELFVPPGWHGIGMAAGVALLIVLASIAMDRYLPSSWQDDGSVNEMVFGNLSPWMTTLVCISVGVGEEWLFRGVVQSFVGNVWTSVIFTVIHVRYLKKPLLFISVFLTSLLLGWLFQREGTLWPSIFAHIAIDLLLAFYLQYTLKKGKGEEQ